MRLGSGGRWGLETLKELAEFTEIILHLIETEKFILAKFMVEKIRECKSDYLN